MAARLAKVDFQRPTDPGERIAYELRLAEIRDDVRELKPLERDLLYRRAQDHRVLDAIESAPPALSEDRRSFIPLVPEESVRARRAERARASNPELAKELADLEDLASAYFALVESARRSIEEVVASIPNENEMDRQRSRVARAAATGA